MLFRKKIERACIYCAHSTRLDDNTVLCAKKGVQNIDSQCLRFRYDPYKRIPKKAKPLDFSKYDEEDFSL
ncbi:MAG: hypothetical protein IJZ39_02540 [Oscillospiraceae bacterium]|nr:hypothetical protein [Oscillospiraceae bacterium]